MKKLIILSLAVFMAFAAAFMFGCEEDSKVTGNNQSTLNEEDSSFVQQMLTEDILSTPMSGITLSWKLMDSIPGAAAPKFSETSLALGADDEVIVIDSAGYVGYSEGWHIFNFYAKATEHYFEGQTEYFDTVLVNGWDSIKIISGGLPVQYPTDQTVIEYLYERAHVNWELNRDSIYGMTHQDIGMGLEYVGADTILTVNGDTQDTLHSGENREWNACDVSVSQNLTVTDVVFSTNSNTGCPESGTITSTSTIAATCTGMGSNADATLNINSSWTVTATVNEGQGTVTFTFTSGAVSWTATEPCSDGGTMAASGWTRK